MSLITLRTYDNVMDANLMKATLETRGIDCYLFDENMISYNPLFSQMLGGVKLKIDESDAELALEILKEIEDTPYTQEDETVITCPKCNSTHLIAGHTTAKGWMPKIWGFFGLIFGAYPMNGKRVYQCKDCDNEF